MFYVGPENGENQWNKYYCYVLLLTIVYTEGKPCFNLQLPFITLHLWY